jgi:hypothetical protein
MNDAGLFCCSAAAVIRYQCDSGATTVYPMFDADAPLIQLELHLQLCFRDGCGSIQCAGVLLISTE